MANWKYRTTVSGTKDGSLKFERQWQVAPDNWKTQERYIARSLDALTAKTPTWVRQFVDLYGQPLDAVGLAILEALDVAPSIAVAEMVDADAAA